MTTIEDVYKNVDNEELENELKLYIDDEKGATRSLAPIEVRVTDDEAKRTAQELVDSAFMEEKKAAEKAAPPNRATPNRATPNLPHLRQKSSIKHVKDLENTLNEQEEIKKALNDLKPIEKNIEDFKEKKKKYELELTKTKEFKEKAQLETLINKNNHELELAQIEEDIKKSELAALKTVSAANISIEKSKEWKQKWKEKLRTD